MLRTPVLKLARTAAAGERAAALVITLLVMLSLLIFAAFAIDTAIWFVHDRHLQIEADAAAFAGADAMAAGILNGSCSDAAVDTAIANYDGTQAPLAGQQLPANQQVGASTYATSYSLTANNLFVQVNAKDFENQNLPNDTDLTSTSTGLASTSPCADSAVDVKMTETNVPSFLSPIHPSYVNKQARVAAETVSSAGAAPFVLPNIATPTDAAVFVVAENAAAPAFATDSILATLASCASDGNVSPCLTPSNSNATWTATGVSVAFTNTPGSLVVAQSTSAITTTTLSAVTSGAALAAFCQAPVQCYDQTDGMGLTYTRTYTAATSTFPAATTGPPATTGAPILEDTSISDLSTTPACEGSGSTGFFTGFIASNTSCNVSFIADMNFGNENCAHLASTYGATPLTVTATAGATALGTASLACPNPASTTAGSANGNWTSSSLSIPADSGPVTFDLLWSRTTGPNVFSWETGGNSNGKCVGGNPCKDDFNIVQRIFSGAYDQNTAGSSPSGPVAGAALTGAAGDVMSTPANATVHNLGVTIDFQSLSDTAAGSGGFVPGGSFNDIAYGTNQANGLADCGQGVNNGAGPNGFDVQQNAIAGLFICTNYPVIVSPGTCGTCPGTVPGNKFIQWLDGGLAARIFACPEVSHSTANNEQNGCASNPLPAGTCQAHPNYWSTQNLMSTVTGNTSDPRLLSVMVTDPGQLQNGNHQVPVRHYAEFYLTGWTNDPCAGVNVGTGPSASGEYYVGDDVAPTDAAGDFFLVGHFVKYFQPGATPSGTLCVLSSIDNCTLTLTR